MSDKVERVAEVIFGLMPYDGKKGNKPPWHIYGNSFKQDEARRYARAAIAAMREPTGDMITAGYDAYPRPDEKHTRGLIQSWQAMIDSALQENGHES